MQENSKKLLILIMLGSILEYYDFAIFIYLAPVIGHSLIPVKNEIANLIISYAIFAIGALCRPLGGMIFAHIGDTRGRKYTFIYTILLMAIPTFCIALIPNIQLIGIGATILLVSLRVFQGFAIGGEIPGSIVFGYELSSIKRKALNSSVVIMGTNFGFFLASLVCTFLVNKKFGVFDSWRLAFILGGIFGIGSFILRKNLAETPEFIQYKQILQQETVPIKVLFSKYRRSIVELIGIGGFLASSLAVFTFYMPVYLSGFYHLPIKILMEFNSYTIIIFVMGSLIAGVFDKFFGKRFFISFILAFSIIVTVLFNNYSKLSLGQILLIHSILLLGIGIVCGRLPVLCATFFPVNVRYSGVAFIYNISFGIVAGCLQMILTWLIKITGLLWMPAMYIVVFAIFALIVICLIKPEKLVEYSA